MTTCEEPLETGPADAASSPAPAGLNIEYNHDLNVCDEFLCCFPSIQEALKDERLWRAFEYFDNQAKAHKHAFQLLGVLSLWLGIVPLIIASVRMAIGESVFARIFGVNLAAEMCGVAAVGLILWMRWKRHRVLWCQAVFCRERLRQWHFQKFLDGRLIGLLASDKTKYDEEMTRRWGRFQQNLHDGYGLVAEFMRFPSDTTDILHPMTEYGDECLATSVLDALWTLRFEHQLRYSRRKIEPEGEHVGLAMEEQTALSETIASMTLTGAILVSSLAVVFSTMHMLPFKLTFDALAVTRALGGTALLLSVLSAASRAYRAGFTLPGEPESYEEYCDRVRELKAVFKTVARPMERLQLLRHLEVEAAAELRRFLRMKSRATFVS